MSDTPRIYKAIENAIEDFHYGDTEALAAALTLLKAQAEQISELEAKAICYVSHNIKWLGEKGAPGWCLGCGKHRSLIRESSEEQQS